MTELNNVLKKLIETTGHKNKCTQDTELGNVCCKVKELLQQPANIPAWYMSQEGRDCLIKAIISLADRAGFPQLLSNEKDDCNKEFSRVTALAASTLTAILTYLKDGHSSLVHTNDPLEEESQRLARGILRAVTPHCLVLIAMHRDQNNSWTDRQAKQATEDLSNVLCQISDCSSTSCLLSEGLSKDQDQDSQGFFSPVLDLLKERLTREKWEKEPAARQAFSWCLLQMKHPHLGEHLERVLPPSLLFVDDHKVANKLLGIRCLKHIINNVNPTELRWYGRAMVIYEALHHQLFSQKPALIVQLLPCLISILAVVERSPHKADEPRNPNRYDSVLQIVLNSMEFEQTLALRQAYAQHLHLFIDSMGITVLRSIKRIIRVIVKYLEVSDGQDDVSRMNILLSLTSLIHQAWPRMQSHWEVLVTVLLKLMHNVCDESYTSTQTVRQCLLDRSAECLILLRRCCNEDLKKALEDIHLISSKENSQMQHIIKKVLDAS
ncbi:TELO2-interacting protein 2-like isoform X2 [Asterias amurensis]|uniref:TELO2-interacting protein 2-like isoform X2 n=1 Tax=Asterias amurensis TaxID=7602 RepID=UPI003AB2D1D2